MSQGADGKKIGGQAALSGLSRKSDRDLAFRLLNLIGRLVQEARHHNRPEMMDIPRGEMGGFWDCLDQIESETATLAEELSRKSDLEDPVRRKAPLVRHKAEPAQSMDLRVKQAMIEGSCPTCRKGSDV